MYGRVAFFLLCFLLWKPSSSEIRSQPFFGQEEEHASILSVEIEDQYGGGRDVKVVFEASGVSQVLWEVDQKPVLNYDTDFVTISSANTATLRMAPRKINQDVKFSLVLLVYQETVYIRLSNATPGVYTVSNHTLAVTPAEALTYSPDDVNNVAVEAVLWVEDGSRYRSLEVYGMLVIPDYCSRPILPLFGFSSSHPQMLEVSTANTVPESANTVGKRFRIASVSRQSQKQGMLFIRSNFAADSPSDPIRSIQTIRRIFFKPAPLFQDFILKNTVTIIGRQKDLVVNLHEDADYHVFAVGNPVPRVMLAKNGVDLSTMVERRDIEEAYFKHAIFRFRNVTEEDAGRYICTAVSNDGRFKQTFTLYVRLPCSSTN